MVKKKRKAFDARQNLRAAGNHSQPAPANGSQPAPANGGASSTHSDDCKTNIIYNESIE